MNNNAHCGMMDDHDKILCERLATTIDHGICKCHERHRITALEAELAARTRERDEWENRAGIYMSERDAARACIDGSANSIAELEVKLAAADDRYSCLARWYGEECKRREAAEAMLQAGRDVMAVIHGDGGHYREAHGDRKAADDAINIVCKLRVDLDEEHSRRRIAEAMLLAGCTDAEIDAHFTRYKD